MFLDDLGMIQDNASEAMRLFVRGVCGGLKAFMVDRPALELQGNAGTVYKLGAGTLVRQIIMKQVSAALQEGTELPAVG